MVNGHRRCPLNPAYGRLSAPAWDRGPTRCARLWPRLRAVAACSAACGAGGCACGCGLRCGRVRGRLRLAARAGAAWCASGCGLARDVVGRLLHVRVDVRALTQIRHMGVDGLTAVLVADLGLEFGADLIQGVPAL